MTIEPEDVARLWYVAVVVTGALSPWITGWPAALLIGVPAGLFLVAWVGVMAEDYGKRAK